MIIEELDSEHWQYNSDQYVAMGLACYRPETEEELRALIKALTEVFQIRQAAIANRIFN
jgi:hypothetical protein